jgi:hypothetical protein
MPKPRTSTGASNPDMKKGNKVKPTTKAEPPPPGKAQSHAGHPHGGAPQPRPKPPKVYPGS